MNPTHNTIAEDDPKYSGTVVTRSAFGADRSDGFEEEEEEEVESEGDEEGSEQESDESEEELMGEEGKEVI